MFRAKKLYADQISNNHAALTIARSIIHFRSVSMYQPPPNLNYVKFHSTKNSRILQLSKLSGELYFLKKLEIIILKPYNRLYNLDKTLLNTR